MTTPPQLKVSPLNIEHHAFVAFHVDASDKESPNGPIFLTTTRRVIRLPDEARRWKVELDIVFGSSDQSDVSPYSGKISSAGFFRVLEGYPEEKEQVLLEVTAVSILYGACREMLATFTARSIHGMMSLPSVTFPPIATAPSINIKERSPKAKRPKAHGKKG